MDLISLIALLLVVGLVMYLVNFIPLDPAIKQILHVVVVVFLILYIIQSFGLIGPIHGGRIR